MNTKIIFIFITLLIFQSCHFSTAKFKKDQSIDAATRKEIKTLNDKLLGSITNNDSALLQSLMSPGLLEKFISDSNKFINQIHGLKIDNYKILDEYLVNASTDGKSVTLLSGNNNENDYSFVFQSASKNSYVSLLLLNNSTNQFLLTAVYGKYKNEWKLNILRLGQYSSFGKTAPDYYEAARSFYKKKYLIDAVDNISMSNDCLHPAGALWQFINEKKIVDFGNSLLKEADAKYAFPLTLAKLDGKPKIFRIYPQVIKEGFFPMVYYTTGIDIKDTVALFLENKKIRVEVDRIFYGIASDKRFIFYEAFDKMPDGKTDTEHYGFVDTLINR